MIYSYIGYDGKIIPKTGVSSSTFIDYPQNLKLGKKCYIGHHNFLEASNGLTIEDGCQITTFCTITTHSSHKSIRLYGSSYSKVSNHIGYERGSIEIGEFSFVGPFCVIMPHTKIGKGSVVAAHSYVKGDFPDFSIIAGNPAKVVGDVREKDNKILSDYPELKNNYMV
jgi:acetyltransferase-like isoleucine patch superfamily enzyme